MRGGERDGRVDRALVVAARGGDRRALDELLAGCLPLVYNIVGRALDGHQDVDDAVQETLIRAVDHLGDLRDPSAFRSWLAAIAMRQVRERWRARQARPVAYGEAFEASLDAADPGADFVDLTILRLELSDQRRETALATRWLDADDRELLSLWWLEAAGELSRAELVDALGLEPGHVSVRVQRLRQQLDTARVVVRALAALPRCADLGELAHGWDGHPASLWRKRFARHTRDCVMCAAYWQDLVPSERLLSGLALVPVPALSAAKWTATTSAPAATGTPSVAAGRVRNRGARHGAKRGRLAGSASAKVVAAGAVLAVVAGAGAVHAALGTAPGKVAAAPPYHRADALKPSSPAPSPSARSAPAEVRRPARARAGASPAPGLTISRITLPTAFSYLTPGYNQAPEWTRVDTEAAPDGSVRVAWPATDGVHVTTLTGSLKRRGPDTVVPGAREVGGLVAHDDGFALLTRVPDRNKWGETAAALVRYRGGSLAFRTRLTGAASKDTAPVLDSQLKWNGSKYGAYFVVHGAGGFADGHYGDKLAYVGASGATLSGGWSWGCSHNEGIALHAEASGPFTSLCFDDWRSGLFVSTGIGAPDEAPVVQREQCWAGYCGGTFPGYAGGLVKSATGRYATAFASRGAASAVKNSADSSGRGWSVTARTATHQVSVAFLKDRSTPAGKPVLLTDDPGTDHVNVRIAPYGNRLLVSWESVTGASCKDGTCTGHFAGTHLRVVDWSGHPVTADRVVNARIAGDIAVLPDGSLAWAFAQATPDRSRPMGASPTTTTLSLARLRP
jgi:RNA polymerase sigma factor (sigma-70 family)